MGAARDFAAFGGVLRSELDFPELVRVEGRTPDWTLAVAGSPPAPAGEILGERRLGEERYSLSRTAEGFRLDYSHAGCFELTPATGAITWYPSPEASIELARWIVMGPVLALAIEVRGHLCLHGSAVVIGDAAIAFVAPKHYGKSTIATALTAAGARFVSDDTLAVEPGAPPVLRPGIGTVRLWHDALQALDVAALEGTVVRGVKSSLTGFADRRIAREPVPLAAVYLLDPTDCAEPARVPMSRVQATVTLAQQTKLPDSLVGLRLAGARLRVASAVAGAAPVYTLRMPRGFAHLPGAVDAILSWHAPARSAAPERLA